MPTNTWVYDFSGEKFTPVILIKVPPKWLPWLGLIVFITNSYLKLLAVDGEATAYPKLAMSTITLKFPGNPPGMPTFINV